VTRGELLEVYGRFYGDEHFAVAFTAGIEGDVAKRVTTAGWDKTKPLPDGDFAAGLITTRGATHNVAIVLRPSNLVVIECDSEDDLLLVEALDLPTTLTVRSSAPYKRHFYFRPPPELEALPYVAFRFESGKLTADSGRYFLAPPSIHPSGEQYSFLPGLGPDDVDVVEMPEHVYRDLSERARHEDREQRDRITIDPEAKIKAGNRRDLIFRYACMLRRWGLPRNAIAQACHEFNERRCDPPVERRLVETQVDGAMKKQGDQELAGGEVVPVIVIEPLRAFLERDLPPAESLVGVTRGGTNLLPRYGWVMPWGREGAGKTSILIDLLYHACAGAGWQHYPVARSLRIIAVVNEGIPGGLQDKLAQKLELWDGDRAAILDNLAIYASPWGAFTFANERMAAHLRDYALDFGADYAALDPLHTLGTSGAGSPQETEEFKHRLRAFGLWDDLGVLTAHHSNKLGMVSGDWARHADTVIRLEKDGKNAATKVTIEKARPADPAELGVPMLLEWEPDTMGYKRVSIETRELVSDETLLERVTDHLSRGRFAWLTELKKDVKGDPKRIATVVREAVARGELVNESPGPTKFRVRLRRESDPPTSHDLPQAPSEAQTSMDTGDSWEVPPADDENGGMGDVVGGRWGPVRAPSTTSHDDKGDEASDDDYGF
jgi:hypothetical protein